MTKHGLGPKRLSWLVTLGMVCAVAPAVAATAAEDDAAPVVTARAVSTVAPQVRTAADTESSAFARHLESKYIDPDRIYSTDVRWWLGDASATDETLLEEIQKLYDGGFRGAELCMQNDAAAPDVDYAYGSEMWAHKWDLIMNKMLDLGMSVYLTSGTHWATSNVPGLDPTSQSAMQNLTLGTSTVAAGGSLTALPTPAANVRRPGAKFVTAYAYRVVDGNTVDPKSFVNLAPQVTQGADVWAQNLSWTAPADGTYRVFSMWTQGTYQTSSPAAEPSYATNYFDTRGVEALKKFWEEHYLADPALRAKIREGDVQMFMDSLEMSTGAGFTWWSEDMAAEFLKRKGYDITPYLYLIVGVDAGVTMPYHRVADTGTYRLAGEERRRQGIVNDYQDVITQLYKERMLRPLKEWLNSVGIETRAQISYGKPLEISEPIMEVDYPEAENYNQANQVDIFRLWTGGAKLENKVLSSETGTELPIYNATHQLHMRDAYAQFAAGFQRTIWHIWGADYGYGNFQWPGYLPGGNGFHYLGGRNPDSRDYDELNAHLGRVQQLMQTGKSRTDVGFIHQNWTQGISYYADHTNNDNNTMNWQLAHQGVYYRSTELQDNGYTYDYFSPRFLFDDDVRFDEKTKTIEKAGYKALVLYQDWLDLEGAKRILQWSKKGLPVVILENAGSRTPGAGKDAALAKVMAELKTLPTVRQATVYDDIDYFSSTPGGYDDNVLEKLRELGVEPYAGFPEPNLQLLNQVREDEDGNRYLFSFNYGDDRQHKFSHKPSVRNVKFGTNIKTDIEMEGHYVPYSIDAWTGEATQVATYRWEDGRTIVPVDVDQNDISLMAFEKVDEQQLHVRSTTADSARTEGDAIVVRAGESGTITSELSNGRRFTDEVSVPPSYDITDWGLTVQSWGPGATAGDLVRTETIGGLTTTNRKASTAITEIEADLPTMTTWDKIPEVGRSVSGTARYEASFSWDADSATGAYLDLGDSFDGGMEVWINGQKVGGRVSTNPSKVKKDVGGVGKPTIDDGTGQQVPLVGQDLYTGGVSWSVPVADVSDYLLDGQNEIVIEYGSALSNVQLSRGVIAEQIPKISRRDKKRWGNDQKYLSFGPQRAVIVPFAEVTYEEQASTRVTTAAASGTYGQPTTMVASVVGESPTGTVTLKNGATNLATSTVVDGKARFRLPGTALPAGSRSLQLAYSGDARNTASTGTARIVIAKARTGLGVTTAPKMITPAKRAKLKVALTAAGAQPRGTVTVRRFGKVIARKTVGATGRTTVVLPKMRPGKHKVVIAYAGNANFRAASKAVTVRVVKK